MGERQIALTPARRRAHENRQVSLANERERCPVRGPDTAVFEALRLMAEKNVGAVLVLESERLVGIFSERDYARKVILKEKSSKETLVREIMSSHVLYSRPEQTIEDCMALMTGKRASRTASCAGARR